MNQHKIYKSLCMIVYMSDGKYVSVHKLKEVFGISSRTAYRYLIMLQKVGFELVKQGTKYSIQPGIVPQTINYLLTNGNKGKEGVPVQPKINRTAEPRTKRPSVRRETIRTLAG